MEGIATSSIDIATPHAALHQQHFGLLLGKSYLPLPMLFVPKVIMGGKVLPAMTSLIGAVTLPGTGATVPLWAEADANFGLIGLLAFGAILGWVVSRSHTAGRRRMETSAMAAATGAVLASVLSRSLMFFALYKFAAIVLPIWTIRRGSRGAEPFGFSRRGGEAEVRTARTAPRAEAERPRESHPMRVAVEAVATAQGGGLSYLRNQLPELERQGISLLVFARSAVAADLRDVLRSPASEVRVVDGSSLVARLRFIHAQLAVEARRWGAEVLYCPGSTAPFRSRGIPTVVCVQQPHLFRADAPRSLLLAVQRPIAWLSAFRASELVHISASTAAEFSRHSALRRSYSVVLSGLGQTEQALQPRRRIRRDAIVVVSNLYAYKRIDEVLAAFAEEPGLRDSYELVIAGMELEPGLRRRLEGLASALGCAERVRFTGFLAGAELLDLYRHAAVMVSASRAEAFPLPPGEALAMAIPVVLSDIPPHRELYGRWARLITPGDVAGLGRAMTAAVSQGCVPNHQVEELKATYSWARNGEALARILRRAATTSSLRGTRRFQAVQFAALPLAVRAVIGRTQSTSKGAMRCL